MSSEILQELEQSIRNAKGKIELQAALDRLHANRDFKAVVVEGYFREEAIRLVHLKADPNMQSPQQQAGIDAQIAAIGGLSQYFNTISQLANVARRTIADDEMTREEILAEDLTNE